MAPRKKPWAPLEAGRKELSLRKRCAGGAPRLATLDQQERPTVDMEATAACGLMTCSLLLLATPTASTKLVPGNRRRGRALLAPAGPQPTDGHPASLSPGPLRRKARRKRHKEARRGNASMPGRSCGLARSALRSWSGTSRAAEANLDVVVILQTSRPASLRACFHSQCVSACTSRGCRWPRAGTIGLRLGPRNGGTGTRPVRTPMPGY